MDADKRKSERRLISLTVELIYPSGETQTVYTRDMSESGLFLIIEKQKQPTIGECIKVSLSGDSKNEAVLPSPDAAVVRQSPDGIGLAFIEMELDE